MTEKKIGMMTLEPLTGIDAWFPNLETLFISPTRIPMPGAYKRSVFIGLTYGLLHLPSHLWMEMTGLGWKLWRPFSFVFSLMVCGFNGKLMAARVTTTKQEDIPPEVLTKIREIMTRQDNT